MVYIFGWIYIDISLTLIPPESIDIRPHGSFTVAELEAERGMSVELLRQSYVHLFSDLGRKSGL